MKKIFSIKKERIKFTIFLALSIFFYLLTLLYLFGSHDILGSIVSIFFLFIFLHFLFLDYKKINYFYVILVVLALTILNIITFYLLSWGFNIWIICSVFVFNISIFALFFSIEMISFNSVSYFFKGGYIFSLLIAITYSFALVGMFKQFPFTCEGLRDASSKVLGLIEKPFEISLDKIKKTVHSPKLVPNKMEIDSLNLHPNNIQPQNSLKNAILKDLKKMNIDQLLSGQKEYSQGVCDMLLKEINEKYSLKGFQLSAVLLTYFLLYGFIRMLIFIMSFIGYIIFKLLCLLGVYKIKKVKRDVFVIK